MNIKNLKFLSILSVIFILNQAVEARENLAKSSYNSNLENNQDYKIAQKNNKLIDGKAGAKRFTVKELTQYQKSEKAELAKLQQTISLKKEGDCARDKIAGFEINSFTVNGYNGLRNLIIRYQSGISGFYGQVGGGMIMQQNNIPDGLVWAEIGDEVDLCLIKKPSYCPAGDERGKIYQATNLKTNQKWILRGSIDVCGEGFVFAPSINCKVANMDDEKIICQNSQLKFLDKLMSAQYQNILSINPLAGKSKQYKEEQLEWLKMRRQCGDEKCIAELYQKRLKTLDEFLLESDNLKSIGTCARDQIESITTRFGDDISKIKDNGALIQYKSGNMSIDYDLTKEITRLRVGDKAVVCMISGPGNCPLNDDRGFVYKAYNLRTGTIKILSDSDHGCGGA